ncbi:MAG: ATP-grasp domain-containing protein [Clostridiaceae bacterium]
MNLFEFEGKQLFKEYGIAIPAGECIAEIKQEPPLKFPFVVKAQVMTGGRGKAGGVRVCNNKEEYLINAKEILNMEIKGHAVHGLLVESAVKVEQELYLAITLQGTKVPAVIACASGGMDIETISNTEPEKIIRVEIDPFTRLKAYQIKYIAEKLGVTDQKEFRQIILKLQKLFFEKSALLTEINPLGVADGNLIAMDSKIVLDDRDKSTEAIRTQFEDARSHLYKYEPPQKEKTTVTFVPLEGNVGLISDGAGTGMLTLDLLVDAGIKLSSFCELGGMTSEDVMYRAMELTFEKNPDLKALIIVLIGGFNRMDNMARGITGYLKEHPANAKIFTRMCGTKEEEGIQIMKEAGMNTDYILTETVNKLVGYMEK